MNSTEALNKILDKYETYDNIEGCEKYFEIINQDIERVEKLEKAIELLKDFLCLGVYININNDYCLDAIDYAIPKLTQEQYELLKGVLKDEK